MRFVRHCPAPSEHNISVDFQRHNRYVVTHEQRPGAAVSRQEGSEVLSRQGRPSDRRVEWAPFGPSSARRIEGTRQRLVACDPQATGHQGVKLMTLRYAVSLVSDDNGTVLVTVPDLPDALTFGEDRDDALARAIDAIESALMGRMAAREEIPHPRTDGPDLVTLPALTSAKVEIYRLMRKAGIGKADMARRLGVALPQIDRMLDLRHRSRLDFLERAFRVLGYSLDLRVKKAA